MKYRMILDIEPKEDETGNGIQPVMSGPAEAAARLDDVLADQTRHDDTIGWRVIRVTVA